MMRLLSKKQICMEGGYMLGNIVLFIVWLIVGIISASIAIAIYFISDGFITRFKEMYNERKNRRSYD